MKATAAINLSSEPFRRDRPLLVASIALALLLAGLLAMQVLLISAESSAGSETATAIAQTRAEMRKLSSEEAALQEVLQVPENAAMLDRSVFLNALLLRKGISWTLVFQDLEEVLPYNVKLVQVRPQVNLSAEDATDNEILLEMVVAATAAEPVIEMLRALETSELFGTTSVATALPPTESEPLHRYQVSVRYDREL